MHYTVKERIHNRALEAVGKTLGELLSSMPEKKVSHKSYAGDAWESWFGIYKNSVAGADLADAGVELKATPLIKNNKGGYSAKERLVFNIINYSEEFDRSFETSSFWQKNKILELGFYEYDREKDKSQWRLLKAILFQYPEKDLLIIKQDWEKIHEYISSGNAHELTEGLTNYLGACTKGSSSKSMRKQHPSLNAPDAKQRAYSLKQSYLNHLLKEYVFGHRKDCNIRLDPFLEDQIETVPKDVQVVESIIKDISILKNTTLEKYIISELKPFVGQSVAKLAKTFNLKPDDKGRYPKQINALLIQRMLGLHRDLHWSEEFIKANISVKTIRVSAQKTIRESMSLPAFKFKELVAENWESSTLRNIFESTKFFFVVFQQGIEGEYYFRGAKFWSMPIQDIDTTVKDAWQQTVDTINQGVRLDVNMRKKRLKITNNFISKSENRIIHVRPHSQKSSYIAGDSNSDQLPINAVWTNKPPEYASDYMTKQSFWINSNYILEQVFELID